MGSKKNVVSIDFYYLALRVLIKSKKCEIFWLGVCVYVTFLRWNDITDFFEVLNGEKFYFEWHKLFSFDSGKLTIPTG